MLNSTVVRIKESMFSGPDVCSAVLFLCGRIANDYEKPWGFLDSAW